MLENSIKRNRIMIIDDSEVLLEMVRQTLDGTYETSCFSQSPDAVLQMREISPDLVIMDYEMPNLNGLEVIRWMRSTESVKNIPVIFLTSFYDVKIELEAFKMGAADYIHKPFSPALLLKRVEMQLEYAQKHSLISNNAQYTVQKAQDEAQSYKEQCAALGMIIAEITAERTIKNSECKTVEYFSALLCAAAEQEELKNQLEKADKNMLSNAAAIYDIGKLCIDEDILQKQSQLTKEEYDIIKEHPVLGQQILQKAMSHSGSEMFLKAAATMALTHHENWDGTGYPNGKKQEEIPLIGRIMAVADAYSAITSPRPWRQAIPHIQAMEILQSASGTKYDPMIVKLALEIAPQLNAMRNA